MKKYKEMIKAHGLSLAPQNFFERGLSLRNLIYLRCCEVVSIVAQSSIEEAIQLFIDLPRTGSMSSFFENKLERFYQALEAQFQVFPEFKLGLNPYRAEEGGSYEVQLKSGTLSFHSHYHSVNWEYAGMEWDVRTEKSPDNAYRLWIAYSYNNGFEVCWVPREEESATTE